MKAYVLTTGSVFGLITIAHIWRMIVEPHLAKEVWYLILTAFAGALCLWAFRLLWPRPRL